MMDICNIKNERLKKLFREIDASASDTMQHFAEDALLTSNNDKELILSMAYKINILSLEMNRVMVEINQIAEKYLNAARAAKN